MDENKNNDPIEQQDDSTHASRESSMDYEKFLRQWQERQTAQWDDAPQDEPSDSHDTEGDNRRTSAYEPTNPEPSNKPHKKPPQKSQVTNAVILTLVAIIVAIVCLLINQNSKGSHIHTRGDSKYENLVAATCYSHGSRDVVTYCTVCGEEADRNTVTIPPLPHTYASAVVETDPTLTSYGTLVSECTECSVKNYHTLPALNATDYDCHVLENSSCSDAGVAMYTYTLGGESFSWTADLPLDEHSFVDILCVACGAKYVSEGLSYSLSGGGTYYSVTGIGDFDGTILSIPETYQGLPVKSIGNYAFNYCDSIIRVEIPDSVTSMGEYSFYNCDSLVSVTIENGVTSIGERAFQDCDSLASITIPDSVTSIGEHAFAWCYALTSVAIGNGVTSIGKYAFSSCTKLIEVINHSSLDIVAGDWNNGNIAAYAKEVHTGESKIVNLNDYLFYTYDGVNYLIGYVGDDIGLTLPTSYNGENYEIYRDAFYNCDDIITVALPDSVTAIGDLAFYDCGNLNSITIGKNVSSINYSTFLYCDRLTSITVDEDNTTCKSIDGNLYSKDGKTLVLYAHGKTETSFTIPDGVEIIGEYAFYNCDKLTEIIIPDSVITIESYAFYDCDSLTEIIIPDSVITIESYAFENCYNLESVTIGKNVSSIYYSTFQNCNHLTSITVTENNTTYKSIDGNLYSKDGKTLVLYAHGKTETSFTIPDGVEIIGEYAFYNCDKLSEIIIPDSVITIKRYAFDDCDSLTEIIIPDSVTRIEHAAFYYCSNLESVVISESVTTIESQVFDYCTNLTSVTFKNPNGWYAVTYIDPSDLSDPELAAEYLTETYRYNSWYRYY